MKIPSIGPLVANEREQDVRVIGSKAEAVKCYPLMRQLRPKLTSAKDFSARWERQSASGYHLLALWINATPVALAGYRLIENLVHGLHIYVDDLVTHEKSRGEGCGQRLLKHLEIEAKNLGCKNLVLDSGSANTLAHRFYYRAGFQVMAFHFTKGLD